jgi:hypothetical protein
LIVAIISKKRRLDVHWGKETDPCTSIELGVQSLDCMNPSIEACPPPTTGQVYIPYAPKNRKLWQPTSRKDAFRLLILGLTLKRHETLKPFEGKHSSERECQDCQRHINKTWNCLDFMLRRCRRRRICDVEGRILPARSSPEKTRKAQHFRIVRLNDDAIDYSYSGLKRLACLVISLCVFFCLGCPG